MNICRYYGEGKVLRMILYVNQNAGREGNGSKEMPFRHINEAAKVAKPGDEVVVARYLQRVCGSGECRSC